MPRPAALPQVVAVEARVVDERRHLYVAVAQVEYLPAVLIEGDEHPASVVVVLTVGHLHALGGGVVVQVVVCRDIAAPTVAYVHCVAARGHGRDVPSALRVVLVFVLRRRGYHGREVAEHAYGYGRVVYVARHAKAEALGVVGVVDGRAQDSLVLTLFRMLQFFYFFNAEFCDYCNFICLHIYFT